MEIFGSTIILFVIALLFILEGLMFFFVWKTNKRITKFFKGSTVDSIEKVLKYELKKMKKSEEDIKLLIDNMRWVEGITRKSVSKVGIARYNPFEGIGGDQSFSIALLDHSDSGVVISSLHGVEGTRVYAKPLARGKSEYTLTEEEEEAIEKAKG